MIIDIPSIIFLSNILMHCGLKFLCFKNLSGIVVKVLNFIIPASSKRMMYSTQLGLHLGYEY